MRKKTNAARKNLLMDGKKSSRKLEKTQNGDQAQKWDWEVEGETKLDAIVEEAENDEPLVEI